MLVEFSVKNYKSIRDEQILSMVASNYYHENEDTLIREQIPSMANTNFLPSALILGANASGKSTLLNALGVLKKIVLESMSRRPGAGVIYAPFALDDVSSQKETEFAITFIINNVRHDYELSYKDKLVIEESLSVYPKGREQIWYKRYYDNDKKKTLCETTPRYLKVPNDVIDVLRDDVPFLSMLIMINHEQIRPIAKWFAEELIIIDRNPEVSQEDLRRYSEELLEGLQGSDVMRASFMKLIKDSDFGILDGQVVDRPSLIAGETRQQTASDISAPNQKKMVQFTHRGENTDHSFSIDEESAGTRRLFEIAGPIIAALDGGNTLVIDELDSSMHPILVEELINLFQSKQINKKNAQMICAVHTTSMLMQGLMRRDEIWFTKKTRDGSTTLYSLSDFKPRKGESVDYGYLFGRYGAIPVVPKLFGLQEDTLL
jgi:AAA15 family ATPase/GTPase